MSVRTWLIVIAVFCFSMFAYGQYEYSQGYQARIDEENEQKVKDAHAEAERLKAQQLIADKVLQGLSEWQQNTKVVEIRHEKTNTVFSNKCLTEPYQRMYNERVTEAESRLSGRISSEVSDRKPATVKRSDGN